MHSIKQLLPQQLRDILRRLRIITRRPRVGSVNLGDLARMTPISSCWGMDRGMSVDRFYIEDFLSRHSADIQGCVLEFGNDYYLCKFGKDRVVRSEIVHPDKSNPKATIIADIASADSIPSNTFDCIICTQTLQYIYDHQSALRHLHRILKPAGVLLATFPGISHTQDAEWSGSWYWLFTDVSARRMFQEVFGAGNTHTEAFGNIFSSIAFLHGLACEDIEVESLNYRDPGYDVIVAVRAQKSSE